MGIAATRQGATAAAQICPYLGLPRDPKTHSAIPTKMNRCHRDPARRYAISTTHQADFCFTEQHTTCPAFASGWRGTARSRRDASGAREHSGPRRSLFRGGSAYLSQGLILFVLVALMFAAVLIAAPSVLFGSSKNEPAPTVTPVLPPGITFPAR